MAKLQLSDLTAEAIADFLDHIEADRSNAAATRNCRRATLRSFVKHLLRNDLAHSLQYTQILAIPSKKARQKPATYLEPDDVRAIIAKPDRETPDGWRDYTLLLFLYNCGARVSEATDVRWNDLHLTAPRQVRLRGKGKKERLLPVWLETADALHHLRGLGGAGDHQHVFANRQRQPLTRDGVAYILSKYALNHWEGFERFLEDGRIELDTNSVERAMRPVGLSRKNSLFAGIDEGGENWACLASLIETCKLNSVNPQAYIADVLTRLVNGWPQDRLDELLPWLRAPPKSPLCKRNREGPR